MFITQEMLNAVLDRSFIDRDGKLMKDFNDVLIRIIDVHDDLKQEIARSETGNYSFAIEALRRYAMPWLNELTGGEVIEGLTNMMFVNWLYKHSTFITDILQETFDYIDFIRNYEKEAAAMRNHNPEIDRIFGDTIDNEKEDTTMKNTNIENTITKNGDTLCPECGCIIIYADGTKADEYTEIDGVKYCDTCVEELFVECEDCGALIPKENATEVDGDWYCQVCFDREFAECENCGEIIRKDDAFEYEGEYYCEDCRDENFRFCEVCEQWYPEDEMTFIESEEIDVCEYCLDRHFTRCERCEEWVRNGNVGIVHINDVGDTEQWCESCIEWNTWNCEECGDCYSDDVDHDDDYICPECSRAGCCNTGNIDTWHSPRSRQGYHFKPLPCMCATSSEIVSAGIDWAKNLVFYGMELEIDRREKCCEEDEWSEKIVDKLPTTYCKTDCSLDLGGSYSGIEIVSHPGTLAWYMEHKQDFVEAFDMLKEGGWLSHDAGTCGLHVHISLHPMEEQNPMAVHNMLIIYDRFWDKLVKFSRRTEGQLDHWAKRYHATRYEYKELKHMAKSERNRYMAVNLTNAHTVEIRMFRGTLNPETFFATLQLVDIITKKCIELGSDYRALQALTWDELVSSDYAELNSYLERRGLKPGSVELPEPPENEEEARIQARAEQVFQVGDIVRPVTAPDGNDALIGRVGTVVRTRDARVGVAVDFHEHIVNGVRETHNISGLLDDFTGWWCETSSLELVEENREITPEDVFIPGMWVEVHDYDEMLNGRTGRIVHVDNPDDSCGIAVEFPGWHDGHNCEGHTTDCQGWFVGRRWLTPVYAE